MRAELHNFIPDIKDPILDCMGQGDTLCETAIVKRSANKIAIMVLFIIII
jgi:hypothetical protein